MLYVNTTYTLFPLYKMGHQDTDAGIIFKDHTCTVNPKSLQMCFFYFPGDHWYQLLEVCYLTYAEQLQ